jgi:hypothetical protein
LRPEFGNEDNIPTIIDFVDSLYTLCLEDDKTFVRFGDGELDIISGVSDTVRQMRDRALATRMQNVLMDTSGSVLLGLAKLHIYRECSNKDNVDVRNWVKRSYVKHSKSGNFFRYFDPNYVYMDAHISAVHRMWHNRAVTSAFYDIIGRLISTDVILVWGGAHFDKYKHILPYDFAKSVCYFQVPSSNAWSMYDNIKSSLLEMNGDGHALCLLSCGPLAKVLAYELKDRMRSIDIGHMLADYAVFKGSNFNQKFFSL